MEQIEKNTVSARGQLSLDNVVTFLGEGSGKKILFAGNSITWHSPRPEIGWDGNYGMAASCAEKDYLHICMSEIKKIMPEARFCVCQVAEWERSVKCGEEKHHLFQGGRDFNADIIIMRALDNCPRKDLEKDEFIREYTKFIDFLNPQKTAEVIVTTAFWKHPADSFVAECAEKNNWKLCVLNDLGELDEMKAIGKFEHSGVANHPGDLGMKAIAERILKVLSDCVGM